MKSRQSLAVFFVIVGILFLAGLLLFTRMEVVPVTVRERPSREARDNPLLALDRWLTQLGYGVRTVSQGTVETVLQAPEKIVYIENSRFNWTNSERLLPWLRDGGRLIVSLDTYADLPLILFMKTLGGIVDIDQWTYFAAKGNEEDDGEDTEAYQDSEQAKENRVSWLPPQENSPSFDLGTSFTVDQQNMLADRVELMGDWSGAIRLVKAELGNGWAIFTGKAHFLYNFNLIHSGTNADLAGELFLNRGNDRGSNILFIRMLSGEYHLLGNLAERGNPLAIAVSLGLLIIVGFWMALPVFGRFRPEPQRPGKPLRERFLAEGRFLAKYHALGKYIDVYKKELDQQSRSRGIEVPLTTAAASVRFADFIKEQQLLSEQLECLKNFTGRNYERPNK